VEQSLKALQELNVQRENDMRIMRELIEKAAEIFKKEIQNNA
jgi:hypothetical protein